MVRVINWCFGIMVAFSFCMIVYVIGDLYIENDKYKQMVTTAQDIILGSTGVLSLQDTNENLEVTEVLIVA